MHSMDGEFGLTTCRVLTRGWESPVDINGCTRLVASTLQVLPRAWARTPTHCRASGQFGRALPFTLMASLIWSATLGSKGPMTDCAPTLARAIAISPSAVNPAGMDEE